MTRDLLLALDVGTTRACALAVGTGGDVRGRADAPLATRYPGPGRVEQDPDEMVALAGRVLRAALERAGADAGRVAALGVVTQRATTLAWDRETGRPLAPALGWQDQRTAPRVAKLRARGIAITTLPSATRFEWWLRQAGPVAEAARRGTLRLGTPDAWLTDRLTGGAAFVTDPGHASCTGLMDLATGDWSPDALALFGVPVEALPRIVATAEVVGETPAAWLGAPVPVAARAGDQQAAAFAQGAHAAGAAKLTLGTSAMLDVHTGDAPASPPRGAYPLSLWRLPGTGDAFCLEGTVITAGAGVEWLVELGVLDSPAALDRRAAGVASAEGVVFVPALQGLGTPYLDDGARGWLGGLSRGTTAGHLARALVDGLAQRCTDLCEALAVDGPRLAVDGGLAASDALLQALADASGLGVERAAELETTALGAALLAGLGAGVLPDLAACRATRRPGARFEPRSADAERRAARQRWRRLVDATRALSHATAP